jgi:serine/threonine protein kinase
VTPERWNKVKAIFEEAVRREGQARADFLTAECGADGPLRIEVERLLAAHDRADGFLETPAGIEHGLLDAAAAGNPPSSIGPYRVLRELGRGGMGTVYLAERDDHDLKRTVAIKVVSVASDALVQRFRTEVGVLAGLSHPGIGRLYDAGATGNGVPYLVMEFVDGEDLLRYCDRQRASIGERLRLFQRVCAAVQYAHQNFVVHRDLKPSNILVAADGEPKLLDFGIAKLLRPADGNAEDTALLPRALTPQYASPEQMRGEAVTTASDVYSLGVILYELLAGARPYRTGGKTAAEMTRIVTEQEPVRPSVAVTTAGDAEVRATTVERLRARLRGDLDNVVLKALQKDPLQRYATAADLAEDIQRHLDGYPVQARAATLSYRTAKFVRRNRGAVAAASLTVASLVAGLGIALWQAHAARLERDRANQRFKDVQRLANALIFKIHDGVTELPNSTPVRQMIVAEALKYLETLRNDPAADESLRIELSQAYQRIGTVQWQGTGANLGDRQGAIDSLMKGLDVLRPLVSDPATHHDASIQFGRTAVNLAATQLAAGNRAGADVSVREAERVASRLAASPGAGEDAKRLLASVHFQYALQTSPPESIAHWTASGDIFEALLAARPDDPDRQRNVALVHKYLGSIYTDAGETEQALAHHARARDLDEKRLAANPANRLTQIDVAMDLANAGRMLAAAGRGQEAIREYEQSLRIRQQLAASDPKDVFAPGRVAYVHVRLAYLYADAGDTGRSLEHARAAVAIDEPLSRIDANYRNELAEALMCLGEAERRSREEIAGCRHLRAASAIVTELEKRPLTTRRVEERRRSADRLKGALATCQH